MCDLISIDGIKKKFWTLFGRKGSFWLRLCFLNFKNCCSERVIQTKVTFFDIPPLTRQSVTRQTRVQLAMELVEALLITHIFVLVKVWGPQLFSVPSYDLFETCDIDCSAECSTYCTLNNDFCWTVNRTNPVHKLAGGARVVPKVRIYKLCSTSFFVHWQMNYKICASVWNSTWMSSWQLTQRAQAFSMQFKSYNFAKVLCRLTVVMLWFQAVVKSLLPALKSNSQYYQHKAVGLLINFQITSGEMHKLSPKLQLEVFGAICSFLINISHSSWCPDPEDVLRHVSPGHQFYGHLRSLVFTHGEHNKQKCHHMLFDDCMKILCDFLTYITPEWRKSFVKFYAKHKGTAFLLLHRQEFLMFFARFSCLFQRYCFMPIARVIPLVF